MQPEVLNITYQGHVVNDVTINTEEYNISFDVGTAAGAEGSAIWTSSDLNVFTVDSETGRITPVGSGTAMLTATVENQTAECIVRITS